MALHTLRYTLPVLHCLRGDAFFYSNYLLPPGAAQREPVGIFLLSSQKKTFCPLAEKNYELDRKWLTPIRMATTSSITMQSLG